MSPINTQSYLADAVYDGALDDIISAIINPGDCLRSRLIEVLGDAGIWPLRCLEDRLEERQRRRARGLEV